MSFLKDKDFSLEIKIKSLSLDDLFNYVYDAYGYILSPKNNINKSLGIYEKLGKVLFLNNLNIFCSNIQYLYNIEKKDIIILKITGNRRLFKIPSYEETGIFHFFSYSYDDEKDWYYITYNIDTYNYNYIKFDLPVHNKNKYYEKFVFIVEDENFKIKSVCLYKINDKKLVKIFQKDVVGCHYNVVGKKICIIKRENDESFNIFYYDFENNITIDNKYNMNFLYEHLDKNLPIHLKDGNLEVRFIFGTQIILAIRRLYKDGEYFFIDDHSDHYFLVDLINNYIRNLKYIYFVHNPDLYFNFKDNFIEYKYDNTKDYLSRFINTKNSVYVWSDRNNCLLKTYNLRKKVFYTMCCLLSKNNKLPHLGISLKLLILYYIVYCL